MSKVETHIDMKNLNRMMKDMGRLEQREVVIGFSDDPHSSEDTLSNAELASIMENGVRSKGGGGTWKIPPRPFMFRSGVLLAEDIDKPATLAVTNAMQGKEAQLNKNLHTIADIGVDAVQESILRQGFTKLSPTTIRIKRAKNSRFPTTQLVDSGTLFEAVEYHIK